MVTKLKVNKQPLSDRDFTLIHSTNIVETFRKNLGDSHKAFKKSSIFSIRKCKKKDLAKTKAMLFVFREILAYAVSEKKAN